MTRKFQNQYLQMLKVFLRCNLLRTSQDQDDFKKSIVLIFKMWIFSILFALCFKLYILIMLSNIWSDFCKTLFAFCHSYFVIHTQFTFWIWNPKVKAPQHRPKSLTQTVPLWCKNSFLWIVLYKLIRLTMISDAGFEPYHHELLIIRLTFYPF